MNDGYGIAAMLAPIDGDPGGVGSDPRGGGPETEAYLRLKDLRAAARSAEREAIASGDPDVDPLHAGLRQWSDVVEGGTALIATGSKDLQVASWVLEGWLRTDSFAGIAAGFTLLADLIVRYWDAGLHPVEDDDGAETRLSSLFGIFGRGNLPLLLQPIKLLPLSDQGDPPPALWAAEVAQAVTVRHDDPEVREQLLDRRSRTIAAIADNIARASPAFVGATIAALEQALAELDRLMDAIDIRTSFGRFGSQVAEPLNAACALLREHGRAPLAIAANDSGQPATGDSAHAGDSARRQADPARDRATALATLSDIAAFFERTEPQSLTGSSLREVVRRASLSLDQLMAELLPSSEQRTMFLLRAGIRTSRDDNDSY